MSAAFLLRIATGPVRFVPGSSFLEDLREGWTEFSSRTWLWICAAAAAAASNAIFFPAFQVLGPTVAQDSLGGSGVLGADRRRLRRRLCRRRDRAITICVARGTRRTRRLRRRLDLESSSAQRSHSVPAAPPWF